MRRSTTAPLAVAPPHQPRWLAVFAAVILGGCLAQHPRSFDAATQELTNLGLALPAMESPHALDDGGGPLLLVVDQNSAIRWMPIERRRPGPLNEEILRLDGDQEAQFLPEEVVAGELLVQDDLVSATAPAEPAMERAAAPPTPAPVPEPSRGEPMHRGTVVGRVVLRLRSDGGSVHVQTYDGRTVCCGPAIDRDAVLKALLTERGRALTTHPVRVFDLVCGPEVSLQLALDVLAIGAGLGLDRPAPWADGLVPPLDADARATLAAVVAHSGAERDLSEWVRSTVREGEVLLAFAPTTPMARVDAVQRELFRRGIWRFAFVGHARTGLVKLRASTAFVTGT